MRAPLLVLLLLAGVACSRSHAPAQSASGSAAPPPPDASIAQAVPAGGAPPAAAKVAGAPAAKPGTKPATALAPDGKSGGRWVDVDPNTLGGRTDEQLADFQAEQRRRDAELMAQDAEEADARTQGDGDEDRYAGRDPRELPRDDGRQDDGRYDPRRDEPPYAGEEEPPFEGDEDLPYDEPPPYEDEEPYDPDLEDDYDPRYEQRIR